MCYSVDCFGRSSETCNEKDLGLVEKNTISVVSVCRRKKMKSAYPSSHSFFDATSDSITVKDVNECPSRSCFSSLTDLFTNPSHKSDLFPNSRTRVSVPEEVFFPAKKKRECEERTSIWHEWGSGECQTENVAQESSGLVSDLFGPLTSSSSSFPNLGSANISFVPPEFSFPTRKNRGEGSSWREERTSLQDWSKAGPHSLENTTEGASCVNSDTHVNDMKPSSNCCPSLSSVTSSFVSSLAAPPTSISDESCFPARRKREERSFWQESFLAATMRDQNSVPLPREIKSGVSSLSEMYTRKPGSACSSLFSKTTVSGTDEVIFPKRKNRVDRNIWRDWTNSGYSDWEDDSCGIAIAENVANSLSSDSNEEALCPDVVPSTSTNPSMTNPSMNDDSIRDSARNSVLDTRTRKRLQASACTWISGDVEMDEEPNKSKVSSPPRQCEAFDVRFRPNGYLQDSASSIISSEFDEKIIQNMELDSCCSPRFSLPKELEGTGDAVDSSVAMAEKCVEAKDDLSQSHCLRHLTRSSKYPPPLDSLARHGAFHVPQHMPWVQLQPIRTEGRFVLQEIKVTRAVVFQPTRKEGRLVLHLIGQENDFRHREDTEFPGYDGFAGMSSLVVEEADKTENLEGEFDGDLPSQISGCGHSVLSSELEQKFRSMKSSKVWSQVVLPSDRQETMAEAAKVEADFLRSGDSYAYNLMYPEGNYGPDLKSSAVQDRDVPWISFEIPPESRVCESKSWLKFWERISLTALEAERFSRMKNVLPCHTVNGPRLVPSQDFSLYGSLRNTLPDSTYQCANGQDNSASSLRRRDRPQDDSKDDLPPRENDNEHYLGGEAGETTFSQAMCQRLRGNSAATHTFFRALRDRLPTDFHLRLPDFSPLGSTTFSCGDGVEKRHHEKRFWEQQPCVS